MEGEKKFSHLAAAALPLDVVFNKQFKKKRRKNQEAVLQRHVEVTLSHTHSRVAHSRQAGVASATEKLPTHLQLCVCPSLEQLVMTFQIPAYSCITPRWHTLGLCVAITL